MLKFLNRFKRILVVEDEASLRELLCEQLRREEYRVLAAADGVEALTQAMSQKPNLILLDLMLPKEGGFGVLKDLRTDPWGSKVPVIVLTNLWIRGEMEERIKSFHPSAAIEKVHMQFPELLALVKKYS